MTNPSLSPDGVDHAGCVRRLMVFFALAYFAEGLGQTNGLVSQPLKFYLKEVMGWSPVQIGNFLYQPGGQVGPPGAELSGRDIRILEIGRKSLE